MEYDIFDSVEGFDWDSGNKEKNWLKHKVAIEEAESVFINKPLVIIPDDKHSKSEKRIHAFGKTDKGRHLIIVFTKRRNKIRIISARNMDKKERKFYDGQE